MTALCFHFFWVHVSLLLELVRCVSWEFSAKSAENGPLAEKWQDRKSKRARQKNKRGDRKAESNDSPEIPGRAGDIRHPWLPFRVKNNNNIAVDVCRQIGFLVLHSFPENTTDKHWNRFPVSHSFPEKTDSRQTGFPVSHSCPEKTSSKDSPQGYGLLSTMRVKTVGSCVGCRSRSLLLFRYSV